MIENILIGIVLVDLVYTLWAVNYVDGVLKSQHNINRSLLTLVDALIKRADLARGDIDALEKGIKLTDNGLSIMYNSIKQINEESDKKRSNKKSGKR